MYVTSLLSVDPAAPATLSLVGVVLGLVTIAGMWMVFTKADKPGWAAIIPIYNIYTLVKVSDNDWWWLLPILLLPTPAVAFEGGLFEDGAGAVADLLFVLPPLVSVASLVKINLDLADEFDQGIGFAAGLVLLPFVFYPLLGLGEYRYDTGPPSIRG